MASITSIKDLLPKSTERMLLVGTTGSGKTTLADHLLAAAKYPRILVIDPKCTYGGKNGKTGYLMVRRPGSLKWINTRRDKLIQYRPDEQHQTVYDYDQVYRWAYRQGDIMIYTDETFLTMHGNYSPDSQRACVTCGRELGIGMIFATQRPKGIDLRILSEAEVMVKFELRNMDDNKRVAEYMGKEVLAPLQEYQFFFWRTGMKAPVVAYLNLSKSNRR